MTCSASAAASRAIPTSRLRPAPKERFMSAAPLQIAGAERQRDGGDHQIERHRLRPHEALDEVGEMPRKREVADETSENIRPLEVLQVADEPEAQQHRRGDERG